MTMRVNAFCSCGNAEWNVSSFISASTAAQIDSMLEHWQQGHTVKVQRSHYIIVVMEATKLRNLRICLGDDVMSLNMTTRIVTLRDGSQVHEEVLENNPIFKFK